MEANFHHSAILFWLFITVYDHGWGLDCIEGTDDDPGFEIIDDSPYVVDHVTGQDQCPQ